MRNRISQHVRLVNALATLTAVAVWLPTAQGQLFHKKPDCRPAPCQSDPSVTTPTTPTTPPDVTAPPTTPMAEPTFSTEQASAGSDGFAADSGVGYIDSAIIRSQVRFRLDAAYDANRPDRAEFFYPKCGCFRLGGIDPDAKGPPPDGFPNLGSDHDVSYQEFTTYLELAVTDNLSGFVEVPVRGVDFSLFPYQSGLGDVNFGFKAALVNNYCNVATFQLRAYTPTGEGNKGLGTEHYSVEPALLLYHRASDRWIVEGEFRWWIPIGGSDYAGDVLRYGIGLTYVLVDTGRFRVLPVAEFVGWTVLDGFETDPASATFVEDAEGDTIINAKLGVRIGFGKASEPGLLSGSEIYIGYGRALTGEVWYKDILRLEYRMAF